MRLFGYASVRHTLLALQPMPAVCSTQDKAFHNGSPFVQDKYLSSAVSWQKQCQAYGHFHSRNNIDDS